MGERTAYKPVPISKLEQQKKPDFPLRKVIFQGREPAVPVPTVPPGLNLPTDKPRSPYAPLTDNSPQPAQIQPTIDAPDPWDPRYNPYDPRYQDRDREDRRS